MAKAYVWDEAGARRIVEAVRRLERDVYNQPQLRERNHADWGDQVLEVVTTEAILDQAEGEVQALDESDTYQVFNGTGADVAADTKITIGWNQHKQRWFIVSGLGDTGFWARITGKTTLGDGRGRYDWVEVEIQPDGTAEDKINGRSGNNAYEVNQSNANIHLADNNIVWLRRISSPEESSSASSSTSYWESSSSSDGWWVFDKGLTKEPENLRLVI